MDLFDLWIDWFLRDLCDEFIWVLKGDVVIFKLFLLLRSRPFFRKVHDLAQLGVSAWDERLGPSLFHHRCLFILVTDAKLELIMLLVFVDMHNFRLWLLFTELDWSSFLKYVAAGWYFAVGYSTFFEVLCAIHLLGFDWWEKFRVRRPLRYSTLINF